MLRGRLRRSHRSGRPPHEGEGHADHLTPPHDAARILAAAKHPLSAEQIHEAAGDDKLDLVTVYRSLVAMDDAGIVQRHPLERGRSLYALVTPGHHHHHHVICRRCGRIERLPGCDSSRLEAAAKYQGLSAN